MSERPPLPPFTRETAITKIRAAEDAWNSRDPERCAGAYTPDSRWRNRSTFLVGREEIVAFLTAKWEREHDYRLIKELWAFTDDRIAVRPVKTGIAAEGFTEVVEGLSAGETVVAKAMAFLRDGDTIRPIATAAASTGTGAP